MSAKLLDVDVVSSNPTVYEYTQNEDDDLCETLATMLTEVSEKEITELTPLQHSVDVEAVERIVGTGQKVTVSFGSNGYDITVSNKGKVRMIAS